MNRIPDLIEFEDGPLAGQIEVDLLPPHLPATHMVITYGDDAGRGKAHAYEFTGVVRDGRRQFAHNATYIHLPEDERPW